MATIIQKPDILSLSGNIKPFEVYSSSKVHFVLKQGSSTLLDETYHPGVSGIVTVDIKEVLNYHLFADLPGDNFVFTQSNLCKVFEASVDGIAHTFRVIRTGVAHLAETPANFLRSNFLTWQPQEKRITYYQPEYLSYYSQEACAIKLKAYFEGNTHTTLTIASMAAGTAYTVNTQYSTVAGLLGNRNPMYYDVWVEAGSNRLTYVQRYISSLPLSDNEELFLFQNSLGGIDTAKMSGFTDFTNELEHKIALFSEIQEEYQIDSSRKYKKNTGVLDEYSRKWILDFFVAQRKWKVSSIGIVRAIVVHTSDVNSTTQEVVNDYNFTYSFAEDKPYLNLTRNWDVLPVNLNFPTPDGLFFLPPRLNEFPRLDLKEEVLIPLQSPFDEKFGVTTWGYFHDTVINLANETLLNALPEITSDLTKLLEFLIAEGLDGFDFGGALNLEIDPDGYLLNKGENSVRVWWADYAGHALIADLAYGLILEDGTVFDPSKFLRSDVDDIAEGQITFEKGLISLDTVRSGLFQEGWAEGFGWSITSEGIAWFQDLNMRGNLWGYGKIGTPIFASGFTGWGFEIDLEHSSAEMDYLTVRKSMRVFELVVNQVRGSNGSIAVSDFNKVKKVEDKGDTWRCIIDDYDGEMRMNMRVDDQICCQIFDGTNIKYYLARVTAVGDDWYEISKTFIEGDGTPEPLDVVVRWNNYTDTNRQGLIYLTSSDSYSPYIDILDGGPELTEFQRLRARIGRIEGINDPMFPNMRDYGIYTDSFYGKGELVLHSSGQNLTTMFAAIEGKITAEIKEVKSLIPGQDENILRNATFSTDTIYWDFNNSGVKPYLAGVAMLFASTGLFIEKNKATEIVPDSKLSRRVLKIIDNVVRQNNLFFKTKPADLTKFELVFTYKVLLPGKFTIGFPNSELFYDEDVELSDWTTHAIAGDWDGRGSFEIGMQGGELLICNVMLKVNDKAYLIDMIEAVRAEYTAGLEITSRLVKIYADEKLLDMYGRVVSEYNAAIEVSSRQIRLSLTALENNLTEFRTETNTSINLLNGKIELTVNKTDFSQLQNRVSAAESKISLIPGQIELMVSRQDFNTYKDYVSWTYATTVWTNELIKSYVLKTDYNGYNIASMINQSADSVQILANKIEFRVGGYNLVRDSKFLTNTSISLYSVNKYSYNIVDPTGVSANLSRFLVVGSPNNYHIRFNNVLTRNGFYTFSFYVRTNYSMDVFIDIADNEQKRISLSAGTWKRVSITTEVKNYSGTYSFVDIYFSQSCEAYITMVQVEESNLLTNWNLHPADAELATNNAISSAISSGLDNLGLGSMAYQNLVQKAMLGNTLIVGGYLETSLIKTSALWAELIYTNLIFGSHLEFNTGKLGGFNFTRNEQSLFLDGTGLRIAPLEKTIQMYSAGYLAGELNFTPDPDFYDGIDIATFKSIRRRKDGYVTQVHFNGAGMRLFCDNVNVGHFLCGPNSIAIEGMLPTVQGIRKGVWYVDSNGFVKINK